MNDGDKAEELWLWTEREFETWLLNFMLRRVSLNILLGNAVHFPDIFGIHTSSSLSSNCDEPRSRNRCYYLRSLTGHD